MIVRLSYVYRAVRLLLPVVCLLAAGPYCYGKSGRGDKAYGFSGSVSREVLENYLARSITLAEFLTVDPFCNDGRYPDKERDVEFIAYTGAKFIGRAIYRWGREDVLNNPDFWRGAKELMERVHAADPDVIFQGAVFEAVYKAGVESVRIPEWAFRALGLPVEERNFSYEAMLNERGIHVDLWKKGASVPDITRTETQLWFMFLIGSYVDLGVEAIHLGQVYLMAMNDHKLAAWSDFMAKVRRYVNPRARRGYVLFDAHTPGGGMVVNGVSMLDFNSFPLRIKEVEESPMRGVLEVGYSDSMYGRSKACVTPSGWSCEALPYLVEFDNFGVSKTPGRSTIDKHFIWGYDEITWFFLLPPDDRREWLDYAWHWLADHDPNAFLEMPGARVVTPADDRRLANGTFRAIAPTDSTPQGADLGKTIRRLWKGRR